MANRRAVSSRRVPRQERAQATVHAVLTAAAQVLVREGYARMTTKEVARVAGVSIGSLYQYYPSKEALVTALADRHQENVVRAFLSALGPLRKRPLAASVRPVVAALMEAFRLDAPLQRALVDQVPQIGRVGLQVAELRVESLIRDHLAGHLGVLRPKNLELAVFLIVRAVHAVISASLVERPELLASVELEDELGELARRYLLKPRRPPRRSVSG